MAQPHHPVAPMQMLKIQLFGEFRMEYGGELITTVNTARLQSLLAYLLVHRQAPQSRQHVAFQFWPDSSEKQAHTNLRKLLFQLRNALPNADPFLLQDHLTVQWRSDAPFFLDVAEVQERLVRCQALDDDSASATHHADLTRIAQLYQGELLPSCLDEWILPVRQQLHRDVMGALEQLINLAEHRREYRAGIRYAQRLLGLDPLHEVGYRRLMQLHALNGDRAAALHDYHTCVTMLQRELGVEPDEETQGLYQRILNLEGQTVRPLAPKTEVPLVGRQEEWRTLLAVWRKVQRNQTHFVSLAGEAGIGKTRLAEELIAWASAQGIRVARTRSYEAEGGLAYAPVTEWLRSSALKSSFKHLDKMWLSEVARLLPELLVEVPELARPAPLSEGWQRQRFFETLARTFLAEKGPLLLLIDDLQWCDQETLAWLRFLLRYDPQARLLVVGTWRSEAVDERHPLQVLLRDLRRANQLTTLQLASLTAAETAELAQHIAEIRLGAVEIEQVYQVTEGHPLFVVETVRAALRDRSPETGEAAEPSLQSPVPSLSLLPAKVQAVIQSRLAQLSPQARELASLAATVGRRFTFAVLARASQSEEETLVRALDELWQRRIVREQGASAYDFSHDKIREVAYQGLSEARRRFLHRRVAETLEAVHVNHLDEISGELGSHYEQAGQLDKAGYYWQQAGVRAAAQFANEDAIRYLSKALQFAIEEQRDRRFELLAQREAVYALQGQAELRFADLAAMRQLGEAYLEQEHPQASPAIRTAIRLGQHYQDSGQPEEAVASLQRAIALAQQHGEGAWEARAWSWLGYTLFHQATLEGARAALLQAITSAAGAELYDVEARANEFLAAVSMFSGAKATVIEGYLQEALACYRLLQDKQGVASILNKLGYLLVAQGEGDYDRASQYYEQGLQLCREIGYRRVESNIMRNLGVLYTCVGDYAQATHNLIRALEQDRQRKDAHSEGVALNYLAFVALNMGDYDRSRALQEAALALLQQSKSGAWLCKAWSDLSLLAWLQGRYEEAREAAERGSTLAGEVGDHRQIGYALTRRGRALAALTCFAEAEAAFQEAYTLLRSLELYSRSMQPLAGLADLALQQDDLPQALHYVEQIFAHLQRQRLDYTDEALLVYLTCHRSLVAANDPKATHFLQLAHAQLQRRAATLADETERQRFWAAPLYAAVLAEMKQG